MPALSVLGTPDFFPPVQLTSTPCDTRSLVCDTVTARSGNGAESIAASWSAAAMVTAEELSALAVEVGSTTPESSTRAPTNVPVRMPEIPETTRGL